MSLFCFLCWLAVWRKRLWENEEGLPRERKWGSLKNSNKKTFSNEGEGHPIHAGSSFLHSFIFGRRHFCYESRKLLFCSRRKKEASPVKKKKMRKKRRQQKFMEVDILTIPLFFDLTFLGIFSIQFTSKLVLDYFFLRTASGYFHRNDLMSSFFPAQLLHIAYLIVIGFWSNFQKNYIWKGRKIN